MKERYDRFSSLILNINRYIEKIKTHEMKDLGLKGNQVQCLFHLNCSQGGLNSTKLCQLCDEDKAAISRTVKELEMKELVFVQKSDGKKYKNPIKLTPKGQEVAKILDEKIDNFFMKGSKGISETERERFYAQLTSICENLKEICVDFGGEHD